MSSVDRRAEASRVATGLAGWAAREADAPALADAEGSWSRTELDDLVRSVAGSLLEGRAAAGMPEGAFIPLLLRTDRWSVVAVAAALHAGVPFAPIDASAPPPVVRDLLRRLGEPALVVVTGDGPGPDRPVIDVRTARGVPVAPVPVTPTAEATVVFTSGSTGEPKGVVYGWDLWDALVAEAEATHVRDADGRPGRAALCLPLHWVAGLRSLGVMAAGAPLVVADPTTVDLGGLFGRLERAAPLHISFPPALAGPFGRHAPRGRRLTSVRFVSLGGLSLRAEDADALRSVLAPDATLRTVYGASETGGVGVVNLVVGPADVLPEGILPLGRPRDAERVRLEPVASPETAPADQLVELVVRGVVGLRYLGDAAATATRFGVDADGTRWWRSGDLVRVLPDGLLQLAGRVDDVVKVNGKLAAPAEAEAALLAMPAVQEAAVVAAEGPRGPHLVGHVVVADGTAVADVRAWCTAHLSSHLVPTSFVRHDHLPRLATGKVDRLALVETEEPPWLGTDRRIPVDALEAAVCALAREVLQTGPGSVAPDDDLWLLGLDSLGAVELAEACAELGFGPYDPVGTPAQLTPAVIADELRRGDRARTRSTAVWCNAAGSRPPVFAIPGAGGTALGFRGLARELGDDQPLVVVEARGLRTPDRPDRSIAAMAAHAAHTITDVAPSGPLHVLGHSVGGLIAYEAGLALAGQGRDVSVVMVDSYLGRKLAPPAPVDPRRAGTGGASDASRRATRRRARSAVRRVHTVWRSVVPGPPDNSAARFNAFTRIGQRAVRRYRPGEGQLRLVLLFVEGSRAPADWRARVPDLECVAVPGNHHSVLDPPHVATVAARLLARDDEEPGRSEPMQAQALAPDAEESAGA